MREISLIPKSTLPRETKLFFYVIYIICISLIVYKKDSCTPQEVFLALPDPTQPSHCYTSPKSNRRTFGTRNTQQDWEIICIVE